MYDGPIIDTFLHGPWIGDAADLSRADRVDWGHDRRLRKVMQTFSHVGGAGARTNFRSVEEVLAEMAAAGVTNAVLAVKVYYPAKADAVIALNRSFGDIAAASGGRLKWIASLIPPELGAGSYWDLMQNSRMLDALADLPGLCGVHITPSPWGIAPNDRWFYPAYAKCAELGLPIYAYVGAPGPLWPMELNNPAHLDDVALAFPDLRIIAHHIGDPWTDMSVRLAARHEHFYICTSAWAPKSYPDALTAFLRGAWHGVRGCDKVIFASDHPLLDIGRCAASARKLPLEGERLAAFLHGTAAKLFGFAP
jgi:predicted TIM-barrel fold metal-dependent hydrolase